MVKMIEEQKVNMKFYHHTMKQTFILSPQVKAERERNAIRQAQEWALNAKLDPKRPPAFEQFDRLREKLSSRQGIPIRVTNSDHVDGMIEKIKAKEREPAGFRMIYEALKIGYTPKEITQMKQDLDQ